MIQELFNFSKHQNSKLDWNNDDLFYTYSFWDETSAFDSKGRWNFGLECYEREYKVRVPLAFKDNEEIAELWAYFFIEHYPEESGFWVKG